jgi:hypothetical protein
MEIVISIRSGVRQGGGRLTGTIPSLSRRLIISSMTELTTSGLVGTMERARDVVSRSSGKVSVVRDGEPMKKFQVRLPGSMRTSDLEIQRIVSERHGLGN